MFFRSPARFCRRLVLALAALIGWSLAGSAQAVDYPIYCSITPAGAVSAGAQWTLTTPPYTSWYNSGTMIQVQQGTYTMTFKQVTGFTAPPDTVVHAIGGTNGFVEAHYIGPSTLSCTLGPGTATVLGRWRVTTGPDTAWKVSGESLVLPPGNYTMTFWDIPGYFRPVDQTFTMAGQDQYRSAQYTPLYSVSCTLGPGVASGLGRWRLTSGPDTSWKQSGQSVLVPSGTYTMTFQNIAEFTRPPDQSVTVDQSAVSRSATYEANVEDRPVVQSLSSAYFDAARPARFLSEVPVDVAVTASVDWQGRSPGEIQFLRNGTPLSGTQYTRVFNVGQDFGVGGGLEVVAVAADGTRSLPKRANFELIPVPLGFPAGSVIPHAQAGSLTYTAPTIDLIPIDGGVDEVGGPGLDIPLFGGFPLGLQLGGPVIFSIRTDGIALSSSSTVSGHGLKIQKHTFMPSLAHDFRLQFQPSTRTWSAGGNLRGGMAVEAPVGQQTFFIFGFVPVTVEVSVELGAEIELQLKSWSNYQLLPSLNGAFEVDSSLQALAGLGVEGCMLGVWTSGGVFMGFQYPDPPTLYELGLVVAVGYHGEFLDWVEEGTWWDYEWFLVGGETTGLAPIKSARRKSAAAPRRAGREYLQLRQSLPAPKSSGGSAQTLQSSIYPYSTCSLALDGQNRMLVWIRDNLSRSLENRTEVVCQPGTPGSWTSMTSVWDDATSDFAPQVDNLGIGTYLCAWQNANRAFDSQDGLEETMPALEIAVGVWNEGAGSWDCTNLTSNQVYDRGPALQGWSNGCAMVVWVANGYTNLLGSAAQPNTLMAAEFRTNGWGLHEVATNLGLVSSYDVAYDGTRARILCSIDPDDDLSTIEDWEIYGIEYDGAVWGTLDRLTTNDVRDARPQATFTADGSLAVAWYGGSNLWFDQDLVLADASSVGAFPGQASGLDFVLVDGPNGEVAMLAEDHAADGSGPDPYMLAFDDTLNVWSKAIRLLADSRVERSLSAGFSPTGSLLMACSSVQIPVDGEGLPIYSNQTADLCWLEHGFEADLAVPPGGISFSTSPVPGQATVVSIQVRNFGSRAVTNLAVACYEGDPGSGGLLIGATQTVAGVLAAGDQAFLNVPWNVPSVTVPLTLVAIVDPGLVQEDVNRANNSANVQVLASDLAIDEIVLGEADGMLRPLRAQVSNRGVIPTAVSVPVEFRRGDTNGPLIEQIMCGVLGTGAVFQAEIVWDLSGLSFTSEFETVSVAVDSGNLEAESSEGNNIGLDYVLTSLDSDADGVLDGNELALGSRPDVADTDGDALSDGEEHLLYATGLLKADSDGDGMRDGDEIRASTDPLNQQDVFALENVADNGHQRLLYWSAKSNKTYQVRQSANLQVWTNAPSGPGPNEGSLRSASSNGVELYIAPDSWTGSIFHAIRLEE